MIFASINMNFFHNRYSQKLAKLVPSIWYGSEGAGHLDACKCERKSGDSLNLKKFTKFFLRLKLIMRCALVRKLILQG
jgi:hypothetical protein